MKKNKSPKSSDESSSITALRLENERLRAELKDAKNACARLRYDD